MWNAGKALVMTQSVGLALEEGLFESERAPVALFCDPAKKAIDRQAAQCTANTNARCVKISLTAQQVSPRIVRPQDTRDTPATGRIQNVVLNVLVS